jgi:multiple sugar transport system permease protein
VSEIVLSRVSKTFAGGVKAIDGISLTIMLVFLAGLQNVSRQLREAASLDGATRRQILRTITLPLLTPVIFVQLILGLIAAAQMMIQPILFGSAIGSGGSPFFNAPAPGADLLAAHIFDVTFIGAAPGTGAALSWLLFVIILAVTLALFATGRFWVFYGSD